MPATEAEQRALADARQGLVALGDLSLSCPAGSKDNTRFLVWLEEIVERCRNLPRGGRCSCREVGAPRTAGTRWCTRCAVTTPTSPSS